MYQIYSGYFSVKIAYLAYLRLYLKKDAKITAAIPRVNFCHIVRKFKKTPTAAELTQELKLIFFFAADCRYGDELSYTRYHLSCDQLVAPSPQQCYEPSVRERCCQSCYNVASSLPGIVHHHSL